MSSSARKGLAPCSSHFTPSRKHRKLLKDGTSEVWPEAIEAVFVQGLHAYWKSPYATYSRGRSRWRNQFLVEYLEANKIERSKKQVASHVQVLRGMWKGKPEYDLVSGGEELFLDTGLLVPKLEEESLVPFESDDSDAPSPLTPLSDATTSPPDDRSPGKLLDEAPYLSLEVQQPYLTSFQDYTPSPPHTPLYAMEQYIHDFNTTTPPSSSSSPYMSPAPEFASQLDSRVPLHSPVARPFAFGTPTQDSPRARLARGSLQLDFAPLSLDAPQSPSSPTRRSVLGSPLRCYDSASPWDCGTLNRPTKKPCFGTTPLPYSNARGCTPPEQVELNSVTCLHVWTDGMFPYTIPIEALANITPAAVRMFPHAMAAPDELRVTLSFPYGGERPCDQGFFATVTLARPWEKSAECITKVWDAGLCLSEESNPLELVPSKPADMPHVSSITPKLEKGTPLTNALTVYLPDSPLSRCKYQYDNYTKHTTITQDIIVDGKPLLNICYDLNLTLNTVPVVEMGRFEKYYAFQGLGTASPVLSPQSTRIQYTPLKPWQPEAFEVDTRYHLSLNPGSGHSRSRFHADVSLSYLECSSPERPEYANESQLGGPFTPREVVGRPRAMTSSVLYQ